MILSDRDLRTYLARGELVVTPLLEAFPISTGGDSADSASPDIELFGEVGTLFTFRAASAYFSNLLLGQLRKMGALALDVCVRVKACAVPFAARESLGVQAGAVRIALGVASFANHIGHVILRGTEKEMRRIATERLVAGVTDKQALRYRAECRLPRPTRGDENFLADGESPMPVLCRSASPKPTILGVLGAGYSAPEPFRNDLGTVLVGGLTGAGTKTTATILDTIRRGLKLFAAVKTRARDKMKRHSDSPLQNRGAVPPAVDAARGFRCVNYTTIRSEEQLEARL